MKKIIFTLVCFSLVFVCLKLSAAKESAKDYHLVQSQIYDEVPLHGPVDSATVCVLVFPDQHLYVFRAFHSHPTVRRNRYDDKTNLGAYYHTSIRGHLFRPFRTVAGHTEALSDSGSS